MRARIAYLKSLHVPQKAMSKSIYFDTGSVALGDDDQAALDEVAGFMSQYPIATVVITGYADTQGSLEANRALAQRRAHAVAQALRGLGGPLAGSVAVVAMGEPEGAAIPRRTRKIAASKSWSRRTEPITRDLNGAPRAGSGGTGPARIPGLADECPHARTGADKSELTAPKSSFGGRARASPQGGALFSFSRLPPP